MKTIPHGSLFIMVTRQLDTGQLDTFSVGEMSVGEMSVGEMSVGEMSVGEMSWIRLMYSLKDRQTSLTICQTILILNDSAGSCMLRETPF